MKKISTVVASGEVEAEVELERVWKMFWNNVDFLHSFFCKDFRGQKILSFTLNPIRLMANHLLKGLIRKLHFLSSCLCWRLLANLGLPWWPNGKESTCQCRRHRFDPWSRKIPWRRKWQPTQVFLPGKSYGHRSLVSYSLWGWKNQTWIREIKHTHTHTHTCTLICLETEFKPEIVHYEFKI